MFLENIPNVPITSANFGSICKMKKSTHCGNLVKHLMYSKFRGNSSTRWGQDHEFDAITKFEETCYKKVKRCGLFIDKNLKFLGASPDGIFDEDAIIEIKCPQKASSSSSILQAIKDKKISF